MYLCKNDNGIGDESRVYPQARGPWGGGGGG